MELSHATLITSFVSSGKLNNSLGETIQIKMHSVNSTTGSSNILVSKGVVVQRDIDGLILQQFYFDVQSNTSTDTSLYFTGNITKSSNSILTGNPISITTDPITRNMTITFGYSNYTGIVYVAVK